LREGAYELVKKRYNVAASRARDQLWVVHSFDAHRDLKPDDLRFQLLQHAMDPASALRSVNPDDTKPESELEREVAKRLSEAGFRTNLRMSVGHCRIGMVVKGAGDKRLAVECDGDRYRSLESLAEDAARQAILERLGWQFVRIRGSAFYRDPDASLRRVFDRLDEMGIRPTKEITEREEGPEDDMSLEKTLMAELEGLRESAAASPSLSSSQSGATSTSDAATGSVSTSAPASKPRRFRRTR
jgi:very-short-patch-repair endonuclease